MKYLILIAAIISTAFSCNVRKNDKVVDDSVRQMELALKDSTTVELIDKVHNFGTIKEGEKVEYNFKFKNSGKKPLVITNASASCGCTVPEKPEKPIMPGEIGSIKVVFNSKGKSGHQSKSIIVSSNAQPAFPDLVLSGEVTGSTN